MVSVFDSRLALARVLALQGQSLRSSGSRLGNDNPQENSWRSLRRPRMGGASRCSMHSSRKRSALPLPRETVHWPSAWRPALRPLTPMRSTRCAPHAPWWPRPKAKRREQPAYSRRLPNVGRVWGLSRSAHLQTSGRDGACSPWAARPRPTDPCVRLARSSPAWVRSLRLPRPMRCGGGSQRASPSLVPTTRRSPGRDRAESGTDK
jgi:hypothetical protein